MDALTAWLSANQGWLAPAASAVGLATGVLLLWTHIAKGATSLWRLATGKHGRPDAATTHLLEKLLEEREARIRSEMELQAVSREQEIEALRTTLAKLEKEDDPEESAALDALEDGRLEDAEEHLRAYAERMEGERDTAAEEAAHAYYRLGTIAYLSDTRRALDAFTRAAELDPDDPGTQLMLGDLHQRLGALDEAAAAYNRVAATGELSNDPQRVADAKLSLSSIARTKGEFGAARSLLEEALAAYQDAGNRNAAATALRALGILEAAGGDYEVAEAYFRRALPIQEDLGNEKGIAALLDLLGEMASMRGDHGEAADLLTRAIRMHEASGDRDALALALGDLGMVRQDEGDHAEAEKLCRRMLDIGRELDRKLTISVALIKLGLIASSRDDDETAETHFREALAIDESLPHLEGMSVSLTHLAVFARMRGDLAEAEALFRRALEGEEKMGRPANIATICEALARLTYETRPADSADYWRRTLEAATATGNTSLQASCEANLGVLAQLHGGDGKDNKAEARAHYEKARTLYAGLGRTKEVADIDENLEELAQGTPAPETAQEAAGKAEKMSVSRVGQAGNESE